jgi:putative DNA methylase
VKKKLIEVALPLEAINDACREDKNRKTGTTRNLHKWFAPMPGPAWRGLLAAALLDDPGNEAGRQRLFRLIEMAVGTDRQEEEAALVELGRLIDQVNGGLPNVLDPFCGGGSTLLEAQRLGLSAFGSDLNPIPVLISGLLTRDLPRVADHVAVTAQAHDSLLEEQSHFSGFVRDVTTYAERIYDRAREAIGRFYPAGPNGDPIIGWWWARTIPSPDPRFAGSPTPLVNDWWLRRTKGSEAFVRPVIGGDGRTISFEIVEQNGPAPAPSKGTCVLSGSPITFAYKKTQGQAGHLGTVMMALITHGSHGRGHFPATDSQIELARAAQPSNPPTLALPESALGFTVQEYGIRSWDQLFTSRQMLALETFADLVSAVAGWATEDGADEEYAATLATFLGLCVGKLAQACSMQVRWRIDSRNGTAHAELAFSRPDVAPLWDFAETNPIGGSVGDWLQVVETALRAVPFAIPNAKPATIEQRDARSSASLVPPSSALIATDPPYFSNFGYADLSNYFYIWIRRALKAVHPSLLSTLGAPTGGELIADPGRHDGDREAAKEFFIEGLRETFSGLSGASRPDLPILIVYAFKQQESKDGLVASTGWEAVLEALIGAGLSIVGTWPIHGTGTARARGLSSNALATYVLLVCRPRASAPIGTLGDFQGVLREELGRALPALRSASIAPVDLAQAVVGPGMGVFSRFARVIKADGSSLSIRDALGIINQALDDQMAENESDFDQETRWAIAWFEQFGLGEGPGGVADSLSRAKGTAINALERAGLVRSRGGKVRLIPFVDLPHDWDPISDPRLTVWEMTHQVLRRLSTGGEDSAADLLRQLGGAGERARELAYRLHAIADRNGWTREAQDYNGLVITWPELVRLTATERAGAEQMLVEGI